MFVNFMLTKNEVFSKRFCGEKKSEKTLQIIAKYIP